MKVNLADAAEVLQELRPAPPLTFSPMTFRGRMGPTDDPGYCCERCEHLTDLLREAGGSASLDAGTAAWFEQQMEAIHR